MANDLSPEDHARLTHLLAETRWYMGRSLGGVDPEACHLAAQMVNKLRRVVRDDEALRAYWASLNDQAKK